MLPPIKSLLDEFDGALLKNIQNDIDAMEELCSLVDRSIMEEPPISVREGGLIKEGYNEDVDKYRNAKTEGKTWLAELEAKEREKTGIKNLKIKYNKVFGYYLEVTNSGLFCQKTDTCQCGALHHTGIKRIRRYDLRRGGQARQLRV